MNVEKYSASQPPITLGTRVAQSRKEQGLTQEELAERVGCDRSNISRIERDRVRPSIKLARQLARELVPPDQVKAFMHAALQVPAPQPMLFFSHHAAENTHSIPLPEALLPHAIIICVPFSPVTDSTTIFDNLVIAFRHMYGSGEAFSVHEI